MEEPLLAAALSARCSLYNRQLAELAQYFGSLAHLFHLWEKKDTQIPSQLGQQLNHAWTKDVFDSLRFLLNQHSIKMCLTTDSEYPDLLQHLLDKPYVLYYQGDISCVSDRPQLSCVGTRRMSAYGRRVVHYLLEPLEDYGICFISGMAFGVDSEVHRTAMHQHNPTVAVLAGGLDRYYPSSHQGLGMEIRNHGCIISEYPPGVHPLPATFLQRNRIVAGLSQATLIIEGKRHSGSLVTARCALTYGRDVGAVPRDVFLDHSQAPLSLLREGAVPITHAKDIVALLNLPALSQMKKTKDYGPVYAYLAQRSASADGLCQSLQLPLPEVMTQLTNLELNGLIEVTASGLWFCTS